MFPDSTFEAVDIANPYYSNSQLSSLHSIAEECPYEFGPAVYMARAMLSQNDTTPYSYYNTCEASPDTGSGKWDGITEPEENNITETEEQITILIYPNPNKEEFYVSINGAEKTSILLEMWNTIGQRVKQLQLNSGINTINTNELLPGIYHYAVYVDGNRKHAGKQVIVK